MLFQHAFPRRYAAALWVKHGEATARGAHRTGQVSVPFEWGCAPFRTDWRIQFLNLKAANRREVEFEIRINSKNCNFEPEKYF